MNLSAVDWTPAGLWLAVVASGLYHGVNPGMGWPLAVSAGLMERRSRGLLAALWPLTAGHLLAMLLVILPFSLLVSLVEWRVEIRIGASLLVIAFGIYRFANSAPFAGAGADKTGATRALVLRRGDWARSGIDASCRSILGSAGPLTLTRGMQQKAPSSKPISAWRSWSPPSMLPP